jgi:hypothetical protein
MLGLSGVGEIIRHYRQPQLAYSGKPRGIPAPIKCMIYVTLPLVVSSSIANCSTTVHSVFHQAHYLVLVHTVNLALTYRSICRP